MAAKLRLLYLRFAVLTLQKHTIPESGEWRERAILVNLDVIRQESPRPSSFEIGTLVAHEGTHLLLIPYSEFLYE